MQTQIIIAIQCTCKISHQVLNPETDCDALVAGCVTEHQPSECCEAEKSCINGHSMIGTDSADCLRLSPPAPPIC